MDTEIYDDIAVEQIVKNQFGMTLDISHVVVHQIPVSPVARATVFLTNKKQLYTYIAAQAPLVLSDIQKIVLRMGLDAELFLPPKGQTSYFDEVGKRKFRNVFPGRDNPSTSDIRYYRTLAPYNPALVQIHEVKKGEILQYDPDSKSGWRVSARFTYRRIKTS